MTRHRRWADHEHRALERLAADGASIRQAARALGVTKNMAAGRARKLGVAFNAPRPVGGGCNSDQARAGWETRRARGWTMPARVVGVVRHVRAAADA
jgi:hypothetical protein